jgi:predicted porin
VSLLGKFGEVRMGRDYTPTAYNTFADEFGIVGVGSRGIFSYGAGSNLGSTATAVLRADNTVGYFLPSMGGLYGHLQMAAGEGGVNGNKYLGGRPGYEAGPINIGFAYGKTETGATTPDLKDYNIQFNYKFGVASLHTLYDVKEWNPRKTKDLSIGATIPVGPGASKVGYTRADRSGGPAGSGFSDADDSTRLGVGYVYGPSKRTAMYTTYGQVTNKGAARSSVLYTPPAAMLGGEKSSGLEFGIRHTFWRAIAAASRAGLDGPVRVPRRATADGASSAVRAAGTEHAAERCEPAAGVVGAPHDEDVMNRQAVCRCAIPTVAPRCTKAPQPVNPHKRCTLHRSPS